MPNPAAGPPKRWNARPSETTNASPPTPRSANSDLARALEEYMLRNIQGVDVLLSTTIDDLERNPSLLTAGNPALINELKRRVAPYPVANAIVVLDAEGNNLGDSLGTLVPPQVTSSARKPLSIGFEEIAADKIAYERPNSDGEDADGNVELELIDGEGGEASTDAPAGEGD